MKAHILQHVPFEGIGSIADWLAARGIAWNYTRFFEPFAQLPRMEDVDFLIVMGGPMSVHDTKVYPWLAAEKRFIHEAIAAGKYVLGICLGAQLIAEALGGKVMPNVQKEIGWFPVRWQVNRFGLLQSEMVFHWHGETFSLPQGAVHLAESEVCKNQAFMYQGRVLALQFHMEITEESIRALITHCGNEVTPAPAIQPFAQLVDIRHLPALRTSLHQLLDQWVT